VRDTDQPQVLASSSRKIPDSISARPRPLPSTTCPIHSPIANGFDTLTKPMSVFPEHYTAAVHVTSSSHNSLPVPVAARSKAWVCGCTLAEIAGSNPAGGMDACLLSELCVVRRRSLRRADHSSRGVLPSMVRLSLIVKPR